MRRKLSAGVDGGLSGGSSVHYTITFTYIESINPQGQVFIFKTLMLRAAQSLVANSTNASKIRKSEIEGAVSVANFLRGLPKINGGT